ncbi:MAG: ABC transporter permease [Ruminococcus sp.]|nr:ABC transporter permease [Ruminococcus sp.]
MENVILLKADIKKHKGTLAGIGILLMLTAAALGTVLTIWLNSQSFIREEMERAGFGNLTAWVSNVPDRNKLADEISGLPEIQKVEVQPLIFANYEIGEQESDSEGQLISFVPEEGRYRFFTEDISSYRETAPAIAPGEIYVSPSLVSMFGVTIGDEITFPIARAGKNKVFIIKGFYEDPFMGSSMIGMKGFLICEEDRREILDILQNAGIDALARDGAMLHIFAQPDAQMNVSELNGVINEKTSLPEFAEFVHSKEAIAGFMLILQNAFSGLLIAFVAVLLFTVCVALGHSIDSSLEEDTVNMGILKTIGFTSVKLRRIQMLQYLFPVMAGMFGGLLLAVVAGRFVSGAIVTTIGMRIPTQLPLLWCAVSAAVIIILLMGFIFLRVGRIRKITPMKAIRGEAEKMRFSLKKTVPAFGNVLPLRLAYRQLVSGKRRYTGTLIVAVLLVFFASLVGRMNSWLGADGKGMMDAFNPADHDIGVQVFGDLSAKEAEEMIRTYTDVTDTYQLAMPGVAVNGVDYTANVISEPERFHILAGKTCMADNEIVLTEFVADSFGVTIGDTVMVSGDSGSGEYIVSGIYSCANDMGDNVGLSREGYLKIGQDNPHIWCWHYFLADTSQKAAITEALESAYGGDVHVHENTWPGLFGIISAMQALLVLMYVLVFGFILIVTVMAGSKILYAEQKDMSIYKAIGFRTNELRMTFALRFGMAALAGSVAGTILSAVFTDLLVSAVMKFAGISNFASQADVGNTLLPGGIVVLLFICFAYLAAGKMKRTDLTVLISE